MAFGAGMAGRWAFMVAFTRGLLLYRHHDTMGLRVCLCGSVDGRGWAGEMGG